MLMMCIEWWTYEIGSFLIGQQSWGRAARVRWGTAVITGAEHLNLLPPGLLSVVELSAQSVIYEVSVVAFMVNDGGLGFRSGSLGSVPAQIQ